MGLFGAAQGQTYPTNMKLGTVITLPKDDPKNI